jgi:hypothetical protein
MWSRILSHFRLAVVVSSWKCSRNGSSAIARGIDAPESTIIVIDPGISSLHIASVSSIRLSSLALDDVVNACVSTVCVSSLSRLDLISSSSLPSFYGKIRRSLSAIVDYSISFYVPSSVLIRRLRMCVGWSRSLGRLSDIICVRFSG